MLRATRASDLFDKPQFRANPVKSQAATLTKWKAPIFEYASIYICTHILTSLRGSL